jgi:hypothetical protein
MLRYTDESKRLVSTFLTYRNDVDIYTEDETKDREFYKALFSRLISPEIKINDVTPLGCRKKVIERCINEPKGDRKKVFIVDGDIGIINGERLEIENLFVLDRYCIENFLIDADSACSFIYLNCGTKSKEEIKNEVLFEQWLGHYSESLMNLFIHFAVANNIGRKFTLYNANKYHIKVNENLVLDINLVNQDIEALKNEIIIEIGQDEYELKLNELLGKWSFSIDNMLKIVSGKDYLIPILLIKTQEFKKSKSLPSLEEVKINLVQHFDISKLDNLKQFIEG